MRRVLHVVESLDVGAVENWLLRMFRFARLRHEDVNWTFYCTLERPGRLDDEARALGARVVHSPVPLVRKVSFMQAVRREARAGEYDVLHCHHDLVSAMYLLACTSLPIARRIVHAHNADESVPTSSAFKRWAYRGPMRQVCLTMSDMIVGISNHTLDCMLGHRPRRPGRDIVHYYGVAPEAFEAPQFDRRDVRRRLGIPEHAHVLLFAGRLVPEKNPVFAARVLAELSRKDPRVVGVFAGVGSEEDAVKRCLHEAGMDHKAFFLGWRSDLSQIMRASEWFILPRPELPMEGFGVAIVEAQLAGLRMLLSNGVPDDPLLPNAVYRRLGLADGPAAWANAAMELIAMPATSTADAIGALRDSPMDMDRALQHLLALHDPSRKW